MTRRRSKLFRMSALGVGGTAMVVSVGACAPSSRAPVPAQTAKVNIGRLSQIVRDDLEQKIPGFNPKTAVVRELVPKGDALTAVGDGNGRLGRDVSIAIAPRGNAVPNALPIPNSPIAVYVAGVDGQSDGLTGMGSTSMSPDGLVQDGSLAVRTPDGRWINKPVAYTDGHDPTESPSDPRRAMYLKLDPTKPSNWIGSINPNKACEVAVALLPPVSVKFLPTDSSATLPALDLVGVTKACETGNTGQTFG